MSYTDNFMYQADEGLQSNNLSCRFGGSEGSRWTRGQVAHLLHDLVGHDLVILTAQARCWLEQQTTLNVADLTWLADTLGDALLDLRRVVSELWLSTPNECESVETLFDWIRSLPRRVPTAVLVISVIVPDGSGDSFSSTYKSVVERVVREGITNAARHCPGGEVLVKVNFDREIAVRVVSQPKADFPVSTKERGSVGLGLPGLRWAVAEAGGTMITEFIDSRTFVIDVKFPA